MAYTIEGAELGDEDVSNYHIKLGEKYGIPISARRRHRRNYDANK